VKTLRKGDKFKRLKNKTLKERAAIQHLVRNEGWEFCDKTTWKEMRDGDTAKD